MSNVAISETIAGQSVADATPYAPSFVDRLTDWVRRLPIPSWLFYVIIALAFLVLHIVVKWLDGSYHLLS